MTGKAVAAHSKCSQIQQSFACTLTLVCLLCPALVCCSDVITAMKAVPSSDVSQRRKLLAGAKPRAVSTGLYTQWKDNGSGIGTKTTVTVTNQADCFDVCDADESCAGVVWDPAAATDCNVIKGVSNVQDVNVAKRSLTRAKPDNFATAWASP
jgi:hypothetical protein